MYLEFFSLKKYPFRITPDPSMFFPGDNDGPGVVLNALVYAITSGEGIIKVVGEVGVGKTMLCRMLEEQLPDSIEIVYIANPSLSAKDIIYAVAFELKLDVTPTTERLLVMHKLQDYLVDKHAHGGSVVVFIEEAQGMPIETLEEIRLLSNLETHHHKLMQIILFGQPELDKNLQNKSIRQLRERITHSFYLEPMSLEATREYLRFRMQAAGCPWSQVFTPRAEKLLARASGGLTRRVNILADKALLAAYAESAVQPGEKLGTALSQKILPRHVKKAIKDSDYSQPVSFLRYLGITMAVAALGIVGFLWWSNQSLQNGLFDTGNSSQLAENPAPSLQPIGNSAEAPGASQDSGQPGITSTTSVDSTPQAIDSEPATDLAATEASDQDIPTPPASGSNETMAVTSETIAPDTAEGIQDLEPTENNPPANTENRQVVVMSELTPDTVEDIPVTDSTNDVTLIDNDAGFAAAMNEAVTDTENSSESLSTQALASVTDEQVLSPDTSEAGAAMTYIAEPVELIKTPLDLIDNYVEITGPWLELTREQPLYTIQMASFDASSNSNLLNFLDQVDDAGMLQESRLCQLSATSVLPAQWVVMYGTFEGVSLAQQSINQFPDFMSGHKPYIRNSSGVDCIMDITQP